LKCWKILFKIKTQLLKELRFLSLPQFSFVGLLPPQNNKGWQRAFAALKPALFDSLPPLRWSLPLRLFARVFLCFVRRFQFSVSVSVSVLRPKLSRRRSRRSWGSLSSICQIQIQIPYRTEPYSGYIRNALWLLQLVAFETLSSFVILASDPRDPK